MNKNDDEQMISNLLYDLNYYSKSKLIALIFKVRKKAKRQMFSDLTDCMALNRTFLRSMLFIEFKKKHDLGDMNKNQTREEDENKNCN